MGIFSFLSSSAEELQETPIFEMNENLKKALGEAIPSQQGLYPHEIALLDYAGSYFIHQTEFPRFWQYDYYTDNPLAVLKELQEKGFLEVGTLADTLEWCTVSELKEELKNMGEKVSGKKADLITRLLNAGNMSVLETKYDKRYFVLTDKGKEELADNEYVSYLHNHHQLSISPWEMNILLGNNEQKKLEYKDIILQTLEKEAQENISKHNFGLYRNTRFSASEMLKAEKRYEESFCFLCEVVACDLSGLENNEDLKQQLGNVYMLEQALQSYFPYKESMLTIPPGIMQRLEEMQEILGIADVEYENLLRSNIEKIKLPYSIFNTAECVEIVMCEMAKNIGRLRAIYKNAEMRLSEELNSIKQKSKK